MKTKNKPCPACGNKPTKDPHARIKSLIIGAARRLVTFGHYTMRKDLEHLLTRLDNQKQKQKEIDQRRAKP